MLFFPTEKFLDDFDYFTQIFSKNGYRKILKPETVNTVQDAMSNRLYFIYKGIIKIVIRNEYCDEKIMVFFREGCVYEDMGLFSELPNPSSSISVTDCEVYYLNKDKAIELFLTDSEFALKLMRQACAKHYYTFKRVASISFLNVEERLTLLLKSVSNYNTTSQDEWLEPKIKLTHECMSEILNVNRTTISRLLCEYYKRGIIKKQGKKILFSRKIYEQPSFEETF
ncbi:Crp/Fnr family transcriptional regulator [Dehalobacter restrictus]|jgi:CRP-like cAMP-binding protein|uniref:Cyclic nucleotide-binding domain-containing protein n=1 Tax=Dehalobacter restrictus (strain DSM 9455 / PER-K23) TaxID=871738 RepID=A0ABM5P918_DEHRP|nr:Crp/Fnr family transcriptional regulator [Dehalobacter restrictus]AHF11287.1 hypothetical protein DEHRE_04015 [Dehalobacter restrictus DSM 9455]